MDNSFAALIGGLAGSTITLISSWILSVTQRRVAAINAEKDLTIHNNKILADRLTSEVAYQREKLERLHCILSRIAFENSQTTSSMDSSDALEPRVFRQRYRDNTVLMHEAKAIIDMHYPQMSDAMNDIYGGANVFWGYQDGVLRININENRTAWVACFQKVVETAKEINSKVFHMQSEIARCAEALNHSLRAHPIATDVVS